MSESSEGPTAADRELSASRAARILYQGWMCLSPGVGAARRASTAVLGYSGDYLGHCQSVQSRSIISWMEPNQNPNIR